MRFLLVNDDGIFAPGLRALAERISELGECVVVAPHQESSAISHAITLSRPLRIHKEKAGWYSVDGTPTDCVYLGFHAVLGELPDMVLSGINRGPNLGVDVTYSGTVAAAMEGTRNGIPSVAFSLTDPREGDFAAAAQVAKEVIERLIERRPLPPKLLLNVNVPPGSLPQPTPFRLTRLGSVEYPISLEKRKDPRGTPYYWIGGIAPTYDRLPDTDCGAIQEGVVSITPLSLDMTEEKAMTMLQPWWS